MSSALLALPFAPQFLGLFSWSPMNCRTEEIDIRSGRVRHVRYFLWCPVSTRIVSSPVSDALGGTGDLPEPAWRTVNTFSPGGRHSPHHVFHGAISQLRELSLVWEMAPFSPDARRESALRLLAAWERNRNDRRASIYLERLAEIASAGRSPAKPIEVRDLPPSDA